jgi:hypothetical protein
MPKFEANDSKGQNATAFYHVLSVLLRGVREAHSLGGLITDVVGPDGLQWTLTFKLPICLANGDVEGNDKLCSRYASHSTKYLNRVGRSDTNEGRMLKESHTYKKRPT